MALIKGTFGNDTLEGTEGNDEFWAQCGTDIIYGRGGNDVIFGGGGNDIIYGGYGYDTFWFSSDNGPEYDKVMDFGNGDTFRMFDGPVTDPSQVHITQVRDREWTVTFDNSELVVTVIGRGFDISDFVWA